MTSSSSHILAGDQRLSHSLLWDIQRTYFLNTGIAAWQDEVIPEHISSNPFMAHAYGDVVLGYLRDCLSTPTVEPTPITIVELGAGSGRLAYHFLHQFLPRWQHSSFNHHPLRYVMTDFIPSLLDFWQAHPRLQPFIDAGVLQFAHYDAQNPAPLTLSHTQKPVPLSDGPLILIANYFFDSIPQDSFFIEEGQLLDNLLTLYSPQPEPDLTDPTLWERLELSYEAFPLAEPPYSNPIYNDILASYAEILPDTAVSFPNIGLNCLDFWRGLAPNGRLLLLSSDRGYTLLDSLVGQEPPLPNLHGSFSLMVNYHAISQYVTQLGGIPLHPTHYQDNLQVVAYLLGDTPHNGQATSQAFHQAIGRHGPDDFFALKQAIEPHYDVLTLPQLLSYLRYSCYDPTLFNTCHPQLQQHIAESDPIWYPDIAELLINIWHTHFPLTSNDPILSLITEMLNSMAYDAEALLSTSNK